MREKIAYEIMHGERMTAQLDTQGNCRIYYRQFLPYQLYLEEDTDIDTLVNNITNFYYWCATRVLTLDRKYAKEILNSIGAVQSQTDRDRAGIALSYHCLTLTDIYWVRQVGENVDYADINLYENHLDNAFVDVALAGRQMTIQNAHLIADDVSTNGCFPKAWIRKEDGFYLLKDGGADVVKGELLASRIAGCFRCNQVRYESGIFDGREVTVSKLMTDLHYSIASREAFEIYAANEELDAETYLRELDGYGYDMMNILDYLVGNTDRHWGNWGLLIRNEDNQPVRLHDLMDFNQSFHSYQTIEGANCQTVSAGKLTQKEAAVEAVKRVGLNQISEIDRGWFAGKEDWAEMFFQRLQIVKTIS